MGQNHLCRPTGGIRHLHSLDLPIIWGVGNQEQRFIKVKVKKVFGFAKYFFAVLRILKKTADQMTSRLLCK